MSTGNQHGHGSKEFIIVLLGNAPGQCQRVQINNTVIISTPNASNFQKKDLQDLKTLSDPGPNVFLLEGRDPLEEMTEWKNILGEKSSEIMTSDGNSYHSYHSLIKFIGKDNLLKKYETDYNQKRYSFTDSAKMTCQSNPVPGPGYHQCPRPLHLVLLGESGSGKSSSGNSILGRTAFTSRPSSTPVTTHCQMESKTVCGHQQRHRSQDYLGESASGKSSSGNSILGRTAFPSRPSSTPVTTQCQMESKTVHDTEIKVIDTPDFFDDQLKIQSRHVEQCREMTRGNVCVYLLVIQIGRFTEGERDVLERLERALQTRVRDRAIILFTRGDDLQFQTIDEYVKTTNQHLQQLIRACGGRYQLFNNKDEKEVEYQVKQLMRKITKLVEGTKGD